MVVLSIFVGLNSVVEHKEVIPFLHSFSVLSQLPTVSETVYSALFGQMHRVEFNFLIQVSMVSEAGYNFPLVAREPEQAYWP
jgi:hypothetical protein